jgi:hypothetical protein
MPFIRFRGVKKETVATISKNMVDELQGIIDCPREYFALEVLNSEFIQDGREVKGNSFVEVAWFERGQEVKDSAAKCITRYLMGEGIENVDVVFITYVKDSYYENGEHF